MLNIKDILPVEALLPALLGGAAWFGVNYIHIAPNVIAPRLIDLHYAPTCQAIVANGQAIYAEREAGLVELFTAELDARKQQVRERAAQTMQQSMGMAFGDLAPEMMTLFGGQQLGSANQIIEMQIDQEADDQYRAFMAELEQARTTAEAGVIYQTPEDYCGCVLGQVMGEQRFDLAAYTASLRLYTPAVIRNIETGAAYNTTLPVCGTMPML